MMHGILDGLVVLSLTVLLLALLLRRVKQPYFIAYIIAGILLGPEVLGVFSKSDTIGQLAEIGVIMLMFFIGAEINLPDLSKNIKKPLFGTLTQVILSFVCIFLVGYFLDWSIQRMVLLSFVVSLSSSAIIFQYLSNTGQINTKLGLLTSGVLIMQDILIVPMMLALSFMAKGELETSEIIRTILGSLLVMVFIRRVIIKKNIKIPFREDLIKDHDLQVFVGLLLCFGFAWITHWFGLSAALGAFLAGIWVGHDKATKWLDKTLVPFRVFFLALFFVSVGLQLNLDFFLENISTILIITFSVLFINSLINTLVFKTMGSSWRDSVYAGALLSQIGEFSFVLVSLGSSLGLIATYSYQITLSVITVSMMLTFLWITIIQTFIYKLKPIDR